MCDFKISFWQKMLPYIISGLIGLITGTVVRSIWPVIAKSLMAIKYIIERIINWHKRKRLIFEDDFNCSLGNWDNAYSGPNGFQIIQPHIEKVLRVTYGYLPGFTEEGSDWRDYQLEFDSKIENRCISWIIRAKDREHFHMIQLNTKNMIRFHTTTTPNADGTLNFDIIESRFETPVIRTGKWFHIKTRVKGNKVDIYIDNHKIQLSNDENNYLKIDNGKIGFRNNWTEEALVRRVRVYRIN